jgi:hypothetical protein
MKKMIIALGALFTLCQVGFCDALTNQIQAAFVGNAKTAVEFTSHGTIQYEFLDNFIEIGNLSGGHIAAIDLAALGTQLPDDTIAAVQWGIGGKLHLSPILKTYISVQPEWQFVNNLEIDGRYSYNLTTHQPTLGLSIGYPFK